MIVSLKRKNLKICYWEKETAWLVPHFLPSKYLLDTGISYILNYCWRTCASPISKQLKMFKNVYKGTRGEKPLIQTLKCKYCILFIWCTKCHGGGDARHEISFTKLSEYNDHTLPNICQMEEMNNTKTTLSHSAGICNSNYNARSITRIPQC